VTKTREFCIPSSINTVCGDGVLDLPVEECDGAAAPTCPGQCQADCTCP
jgi:hypothetical protein